ncbi:HET-domain-containing protein [Hypoxylon sp. EC38]|nr:HET-domain-containing protein [Hypoxylon sp. EC38]
MSTSFIHHPLTKPDEIRLLFLEPASNQKAALRGSFEHIILSDHYFTDPYTAVSYVWGSPTATDTIFLDDHEFRITANLAAALREIRNPTRVHRLWVDALCIDQKNTPERNHQVALMRDIFYSASKTIIYLGPLKPEAELIIDQLPRSSLSDNTITTVDLVKYKTNNSKILREVLDAATENLLTRAWFHRVWTFQELVVSREPWVQFGKLRMQWTILYNLFQHSSTPQGNTKNTLAFMNQVRKSFHTSRNKVSDSRRLWRILKFRMGSQATDPRDMIYANMGFHSDRHPVKNYIEIDYSKPIRDVFIEAGRYVVDSAGFQVALCGLSLDSPLRSILPSWVPDWGVDISPELLDSEKTNENTSYPSSSKESLFSIDDRGHIIGIERITSLIPPPESFSYWENLHRKATLALAGCNPDHFPSLWDEFTRPLSALRPEDPHPINWLDGMDNKSGLFFRRSALIAIVEYFRKEVYRSNRYRLAFLSNKTVILVNEDACTGDDIVILYTNYRFGGSGTGDRKTTSVQMVTRKLDLDPSCDGDNGTINSSGTNTSTPGTYHRRVIGQQEMEVIYPFPWVFFSLVLH